MSLGVPKSIQNYCNAITRKAVNYSKLFMYAFDFSFRKKHCSGFEATLNSMLTPTNGSSSGLTRLMTILCTYVISGHLALANEIYTMSKRCSTNTQ
jgi:hypothetical protein